jgi:Capsule polysaccharide biosynthesis protein
MTDTLFAVSRIPEWKGVAQKLLDSYGVRPVYWICSREYKPDIEAAFPGIIYHETVDANRGLFPDVVQVRNRLNKRVILEYAELEREFYVMLNRHDLDGSFSYEERKRLYYVQLNYWLNLILEFGIELVLFAETPHAISHFVLYGVCRKLGIQTAMLSLTTIPGTLYAKKEFFDIPSVVVDRKDDEKLAKLIHQNIDTVRNSEDKPWYMLKQRRMFIKAGYTIRLQAMAMFLPLLLEKIGLKRRKSFKNFYKHQGVPFEKAMLTRSEFALKRVDLRRRQAKLRLAYRRRSQAPDLDRRYLYYPLHFQPERSSCPEGSVFADQQLLIQLIADRLPPDTWLYVKEHPSQFMMTRGALGRPPHFYEDISHHPRVVLVDDSFSSRQLIDHSLAVVTLTGTAGLEALLRGKPALIFGYAWYRHFPGVYALEDETGLDQALAEIVDPPKWTVNDVLETIEKQKQFLFPGYVTRWSSNSITMSVEENTEALYQGFSALLKHLGYKENRDK